MALNALEMLIASTVTFAKRNGKCVYLNLTLAVLTLVVLDPVAWLEMAMQYAGFFNDSTRLKMLVVGCGFTTKPLL